MIDYEQIDKFYTGLEMPVLANYGGVFLELGDVIRSNYVIFEESLQKVQSISEIKQNCGLIKRLTFNPQNYHPGNNK